jgi:hypothetical protein
VVVVVVQPAAAAEVLVAQVVPVQVLALILLLEHPLQ